MRPSRSRIRRPLPCAAAAKASASRKPDGATHVSAVIQNLVNQPYKHGFVTDIESDVVPKGLNEDAIRLISLKKNEPYWLLDFRLQAYRHWLTMTEPTWPNVKYP